MFAEVLPDGGHGVGEGLGLVRSEGVEDQALDILDMDRREVPGTAEATRPEGVGADTDLVRDLWERSVELTGVAYDALDRRRQPVGEALILKTEFAPGAHD